MSLQEYDSEFDPRVGMTPAVKWLIAANVAVYFLQLAIFGDNITDWFALVSERFPAHWWGVGTYMFVHAGLAHVGANMIMLWMFGPRVERAFGVRSFLYFYVWCGVGGAIFHLLFVRDGAVVGASAAVVGVILAYALRWPDDEVYILAMIPMKARWLAVWTILINVAFAVADWSGYSKGSTAWMAHVGGLAFAWLYLNAPTVASLDRIRMQVNTIPDEPDQPKPIPKAHRPKRREESPQTADEAVARSNALVKRRSAPIASLTKPEAQADDVNSLLDKISREGIESLTPAERKLLEDVSRRLRNT